MVIEVNDNPNLDAGVEDFALGNELYIRLMREFLRRLDDAGLSAPGSRSSDRGQGVAQ